MSDCSAAEDDFFERKIRPLLIEHCYECHSLESGESSGDLRLDTRSASRRGGARGPAVVPGNVEASLLIKAVTYRDAELEMPPAGKLADEQIEILRRWVAEGAVDPRSDGEPEPASSEAEDPSQHWAFQTPQRAVAPSPSAASQPHDADDMLDAIVQDRLQSTELEMAEPTDRATLASRLYYDLTGLPAPSEAVERFVHDEHPAAVQRLVDRLLASPEFGERFARHWLDVARYANTVGYTLAGRERLLKGSEGYRDWAVRAFNEDLPYDEMIRYQLAADRLDPENENGHLDAMGFLTVGRRFLSKHDTIDDRIDVISRGLLGLTVSCARCHDHKFDPIPTSDYYSWVGIMESSRVPDDGKSPLMLVDENPHDAFVLIRGQRGNRGERVPRQYLTVFRDENEQPFETGSGRLDLAERIVRPDNPLSARVMVNRIWGHLVGKPLVTTTSDFGVRTEPPVHPEVLDDLAADFVRDWSVKRIARRIVTTRIYGQRSQTTDTAFEIDPDNQLLARANRRRRDFESLRDAMLVAGNHLQRRFGGDPVDITVTPVIPRRTLYAFIDRQDLPGLFRTFDFASPDAHTPERAFTTVPQQALYLLNGDLAMQMASEATKIARQSVTKGDAEEQEPSTDSLVDSVFQQVLRRSPSDQERELAVQFVNMAPSHDGFQSKIAIHFEGEQGERVDADSADDFSGPFSSASSQPLDRLTQLAHSLLMSNEFVFVD